eukprot:1147536-Pelagomonas_calceolata.AAC.2
MQAVKTVPTSIEGKGYLNLNMLEKKRTSADEELLGKHMDVYTRKGKSYLAVHPDHHHHHHHHHKT